MSGTISLSMTQQFDEYGDPLEGGKLYFIVAGTVSTPQNAYQDDALTLAWPNPITLDATGRVPQLFLADGVIKIRLTDENGVVQLVADNIQVIGASSGGGGGSGMIDATTIYQTGDLKARYGTGAHTGWVRGNARTIGNSLSGATELANDADAVALYTYLWNTDANLTVSGGRGANAAADFAAGKTLTLPDFRGTIIGGMDDMGSAAAGRLSFGTVLGARGGAATVTLAEANLAAHRHTLLITDPGHVHQYFKPTTSGTQRLSGTSTGGIPLDGGAAGPTNEGTGETSGVYIQDGSGNANMTAVTGNTTPFGIVQHTMVCTIYIKL